MEDEIKRVAEKLVSAIDIHMNPYVSQKEREDAYKICEDFKENSPLCVQCGLQLTNKDYSSVVRHFGLQLIEHVIKFKWNGMTQEEKVFIKDNAMQLLATGTEHILVEHCHIKFALSRIIVEMVKREWPQHWPSFLQEMYELSAIGETQKELVLLIFLRLAEDIVAFQSIQNQRRRQIYQAMTLDLNNILTFFLQTLQSHYQMYVEMRQTDKKEEMMVHCRVVEATLMTLAGFVEWVPISQITKENNILFPILSLLLESQLQLYAAECLLLIVSRKGKIEERKPLLVLFEEGAMSVIFSAASAAALAPLEEQHYIFLKKLCQVLTGLGSQLCLMWGTTENFEPPKAFPIYLNCIVAFTSHASQVLSSYTQTLWAAFFRHRSISQNPCLQAVLSKVVESDIEKLMKVGFPSGNDSLSCEYSRIDFHKDEDYHSFYIRFRAEVTEALRWATILNPTMLFGYASQWLTNQLQKPIDVGAGSENGFCHTSSPSYIQWSALALFLECVLSRILASDKPKPPAEEGIILLKTVLKYDTQVCNSAVVLKRIFEDNLNFLNLGGPKWDIYTMLSHPFHNYTTFTWTILLMIKANILGFHTNVKSDDDPLILSSVLSCISALFVFLTLTPDDILPAVLDKIFSAVVFNFSGQTKATRSKAVKNVRRHACSSLVKICKQHPKLLLPAFEQMYNQVKNLCQDPDQLSQLEKCTLLEALVLISNEFHDYNKQLDFLKEIFNPVSSIWLSSELQEAFSSVENFMAHIGLDRPPVEPGSDDIMGINRSQIIYCVSTILGVIKRSRWPDDPEVAKKGGFLCEFGSETGLHFCNPATPYVSMLLERLFSLIGVLNGIWRPEALSKIHSEFATANDMLEVEKQNILGQNPQCLDFSDNPAMKQPPERMKHFMSTIHETCYHILGNSGPSLGADFYAIPNLATAIVSSVFADLNNVPDYRLRPVIRIFMKPFIQHCPPQFYQTALIPVLEVLCPLMFERLSAKWEQFKQRYGTSSGYEEEMTESQEVLDDQVNRQVTREYVDLLDIILHGKKVSIEQVSELMEEEAETSKPASSTDGLSELGIAVIRTETVCPSVVMTICDALHWLDTTTCLKSVQLCSPVLKQLLSDSVIQQPEEASYILQSVLKGLQELGEHEANQALLLGLGLQTYETLRPVFPTLQTVLAQVTGCTQKDLQSFDEKILQTSSGKITEKRKKDMFRKLVLDIIGTNIGQQFKKEVHIKNLPPLFCWPRKKNLHLEDLEEKNMGLCELFQPDQQRKNASLTS
ncbi:exportin-5-like protein Ranbp21 [Tachypleus tridentatus]|uniref:exportin-5-like protein Ranbp21 n=1 Tax=Tachypleus tridentatus TaxID=6853 RepID=UPI003FCF922F